MKQSFIIILVTLLMSMTGVKLFAHDIAVQNADGVTIYYVWTNNKTELAVSFEGWDEDEPNHYYGNVVIPKSVLYEGKTYSVTSIGYRALHRSWVTSVTIPNSIKSIGNSAFKNCSSLNSVSIPNSVTSIGWGCFQGCSSLTNIISEIESPFVIDNTVFSDIPSNAQLIVPKGTKSKYQATAGWNFMNIVEATGSGIGDFSDNGIYYNIKSDGSLEVTGVATWATTADIPSSIIINGTKYRVTSIGERAFEGRSDITYLSIPYSIKSIGKYAFIDCGSNMTVNIADPESWCQMQLGNEHASPLSSAGKMLVHDIETTSFTVPETVTSIGAFTFYQCSCLESLYIPGSVTSIGSSAFEDCDYLTSVTLSEGLQSIGGSAFEGCKRLSTLTIPGSVTFIGSSAFTDCDYLTSLTLGNGLKSIGANLFERCKRLKTLTIPNSVTVIGDNAFRNCSGMTSITIGNGLSKIEDEAFYGCNKLTSVYITDLAAWCNISHGYYPLPTYAHHLYLNGEEIKDLIIPNSVTSIKNYAFMGCSGISSVTIPQSVTSIGYAAFSSCSGLTSVVSQINNPFEINESVFYGISTNAQLIVPIGSMKKYKSAQGWNMFTNIAETETMTGKCGDNVYYLYERTTHTLTIYGEGGIDGIDILSGEIAPWEYYKQEIQSVVIKTGVTYIGMMAFYDCSSLTSISIPSSLTYIGMNPFGNCNSLASVHITDLAAWCKIDIGDNPLSYAHHLYLNGVEIEDLVIPNGVITIKDRAFCECSGISSITIPNSVISIGMAAFSSCKGLTSVTIPNSVTSISEFAFNGCSGLTSVITQIEEPFMVNDNVFNGIPSNAKLIVPKGTKAKYQATEGWNVFTNIVEEGSVLEGDVNGDGIVNESDANDVASYILGKTPTGFNKDSADLNGDHKVNVADIVLINIIIKKNK